MKYIKAHAFLGFWQASIVAAANEADHPFIRRLQAPQLPQCGNPSCWCDVSAASSTTSDCPAYPNESIYTGKTDVADFFASLELRNPGYIELQLCTPDLSTSVNLEGISVNPNILCEEGILVDGGSAKAGKSKAGKSKAVATNCLGECKDLHGDDAVCGIKLMHNGRKIKPDEYDDNCASDYVADSYTVRTFMNDDIRKRRGYFILHEGACGVCSTAQDMASFMRNSFPDPMDPKPTIDTMSFLCQMTITQMEPGIPPKDLVEKVSQCLQHGIGQGQVVPSAELSETCAYAWAINVFLTGLPENVGGCNAVCTEMLNLLLNNQCLPTPQLKCPYDPVDCSLKDCLGCDDSVSGSQFIELSGMTRRYAGIHTMLPRPCGSLAEISHTCVAEIQ